MEYKKKYQVPTMYVHEPSNNRYLLSGSTPPKEIDPEGGGNAREDTDFEEM